MNYYQNNLYPNYPYVNAYPSNQYSPNGTGVNFNSNLTNPMSLLGKVVDGEDVVKATEIPIGGFGVFPKADLNEIYVKTWNNNGATQILKYQPIAANNIEENNINETTIILEKINSIEAKLNELVGAALPQPQVKNDIFENKRKELNINAY